MVWPQCIKLFAFLFSTIYPFEEGNSEKNNSKQRVREKITGHKLTQFKEAI